MHNSFRRSLLVSLAAAGIGISTGGTSYAARADWSFERVRGGAYAQSCERFGQQRVCAVIYCGRDVDGLDIGITGWEPRGRGDRRHGSVEVDGSGRDVNFAREMNDIVGEVWRVDVDRGERRLINRMKLGSETALDVRARGPAFVFSLDGSYDAISRVEERCDRRDGGRDRHAGRDRERDEGQEVFRFGDDDFGIELRLSESNGFGFALGPRADRGVEDSRGRGERRDGWRGRDRWTRLTEENVARGVDRDVIRLDRGDGRFDALGIRALRNDVTIYQVLIEYGNGNTHQLDFPRRLEQGQEEILQLRGRNVRSIDRVVLVYGTRGRGPEAAVEVWGRRNRDS